MGIFKNEEGVAGETSLPAGAFRLCRWLDLAPRPFAGLSNNLVPDGFRGGGGGIEDDGNGSGDTESADDGSLCEPFAFRFKLVIEFRFRLWGGLLIGENGALRTLRPLSGIFSADLRFEGIFDKPTID